MSDRIKLQRTAIGCCPIAVAEVDYVTHMPGGNDVVVAQQMAAGLVNVRSAVDSISELATSCDVLYPLPELLGVQRVPGAARYKTKNAFVSQVGKPQTAQLLQLKPLLRRKIVDDG